MRTFAKKEVSLLIAEDRPTVKSALRRIHIFLQTAKKEWIEEAGGSQWVPLRQVRDTVHFAEKADSRLLQLADVCAFVVKRHLMKKDDVSSFHDALKGQLIWHLKGEEPC
jgi:hypothetical protein